MASPTERRALDLLAGWLASGAPDDAPPALPPGTPPERLGALYEWHLVTGRRQRGAYYTPPALVAPLLDGVLPAEGAVLDPACGAGAFLLAAAERLGPSCLPRLLGRDSDPGAVAVARLALALRLQVPLAAVSGLRTGDALRDEELRPGTFAAIIGNPPFLGEEDHGALLRGLRGSRVGAYLQPRTDLAYLFAHLCLDLLRPGGRLGLVLPEGLLHADGASGLRRRLLGEARLERVVLVDLPAPFPKAPGQRCCLVLARKGPAPAQRPRVLRLDEAGLRPLHRAPPQRVLLDGGGAFRLAPPAAEALCARMERVGRSLGADYAVDTGVQAGPSRLGPKAQARCGGALPAAGPGVGVFVLHEEEVAALGLGAAERSLLRPFYYAGELPRLGPLPPPRHWLLYLTAGTCPSLAPYPALERHLRRFRPLLERRRETRRGTRAYFHLHWPRSEPLFLGPKLLSVRQTPQPRVTLAPGPAFVDLAVNVIRARPGAGFGLPALAALLSAAPVHHYLAHRGKRKGPLLQVDGGSLMALPLPPPDAALDAALGRLAERLMAAAGPAAAALQAEIDHLAAEAYGLPPGPWSL